MGARDAVRRDLRAAARRLPELFAPATRLVVGYSGGQDSTCLLHALAHGRFRVDVLAVHVDHALRGESAVAARQVVAAGAHMGLEVEVVRVDVAAYRARVPGWSVQQAARAARYHALASVAQRQQAKAVLVAHTADDQAETLLLNLLRGTGLGGLAGMRADETLVLPKLGPAPTELSGVVGMLRVARPLLRVARSTTSRYCAELGLFVVEDASNQSRDYTRNRVRLDLLPALERFNPAVRSVLARTADLAGDDVAALEAVVAQLGDALARPADAGARAYDLRLWRAQPRALQRRLLRRALDELLGTLVDVGAAPIDDALDLVRSGTPAQTYHLPYGVELRVETDTFQVRVNGRAMHRAQPPNTWGAKVSRV